MRVAVVPDAVALEAAGDMHVGDRIEGQRRQRLGGVLAPVDVVGVQVGHVDQQPHAGPLDQLGQELALGQLLTRPGEQRGDVLQGQRHRQRVLRDADVLAQHVQRVPGARHGQQVAGLQARGGGERAARPDVGDVLGDQR